MEAFLIVGVAGAAMFGFLWMIGVIDKNVLLCSAGFHKMDKPKPGCIGMIQCERRGGELNFRCKHTIVYDYTDK